MKQDSNRNFLAGLTVGLVLTGVAIIIIQIIFDFWVGNATAAEWLRGWQTLITGILAVAAASATIYVMIVIETAQQKRHEQLFRLNMRNDTLVLERAVVPHIHYLCQAIEEAKALFNNKNLRENPTEAYVDEISAQLAIISDEINSNDIKAAEHLFGARTHQDIILARELIQELAQIQDRIVAWLSIKSKPEERTMHLRRDLDYADGAFRSVKIKCELLSEDLEMLLKSYEGS